MTTPLLTFDERCSCGATFACTGPTTRTQELSRTLDYWRVHHRHETSPKPEPCRYPCLQWGAGGGGGTYGGQAGGSAAVTPTITEEGGGIS